MPVIDLTNKNMDLFKAVMEVMKANIDWDQVAKKTNMKSSKYARDQWTIVRNKLIDSDGNGGSKTQVKAAAGTKRKDSAASTRNTSAKKARATPKNVTSSPVSEDGDHEDAELGPEAKDKDDFSFD